MYYAKKKSAEQHQKMTKGKMLKRIFFLTLGAFIMAIGLEMALIPNNLMDGGVTGISIVASDLTGLPLGVFLVLLNLPFLYLGYKQIGKTFALSAIYGIVILSISSTLLHHSTPITDDVLLAMITGGVLLGVGVGIAIRAGGCLDGSETLAILFSQKTHFTVGQIILIMNVLIMGMAGLLYGFDRSMYSFLAYFVAMKTIDLVTEGFNGTKSVWIISNYNKEIGDAIMNRLGRGVTYLKGKGAYTKEERAVIFCMIDRLEETKVRDIVQELDPQALLAFSNISDVQGGNFKKKNIH